MMEATDRVGSPLSSPLANGVVPASPAQRPVPPPLPPPSQPPTSPSLTPFLRSCISRIPPRPSHPPTPYSTTLSQPPFITLTYAQSLDGSLASTPTPPTPLLLSSTPSMTITHLLRSLHSSLIIGRGTLQSDNPRLTTRLTPGPSPTPVILDSALRMDEGSRVLHSHPTVWVVCTDEGLPSDLHPPVVLSSPEVERIEGGTPTPLGGKWQRLRRLVGLGCVIVVLPALSGSSHVPLALAFSVLGRYFPSIMVEGGAGLITSCLSLLRGEGKGVPSPIHQVIITLAPVYVGGVRSVTRLMEEPFPRMHSMTCEKVGDDVIVRALVGEQRDEEEEGVALRLQAVWSPMTEKLVRLLRRMSESILTATRLVTVKRVAVCGGVAALTAVVCCDAVLSLDAQLLSKRWSSGTSQWLMWFLRYLHSRRSYIFIPILLVLYFRPPHNHRQRVHSVISPPLLPSASASSPASFSAPLPLRSPSSYSVPLYPSQLSVSSLPSLPRPPAMLLTDGAMSSSLLVSHPHMSKASAVLAEIKSRRQSLVGGRKGGGGIGGNGDGADGA